SAGAAANSATSSADLLTDLKSGYLLGANPRKQFLAQFIGVFFGTLVIVPVWYLLVPDQGRFIGVDAYAAPATNQWYKVAEVLTKGIDQLPASARWSIFIGAMVGILLPLVERFAVPARFRKLMPSAMGLGLSWMLPFANA
ncbi:MAG: OPT/YSL family transporter, partial [Phycisphaerales bacterium]|nr:OPT/YSL family transporter [Phycisphaerales bacterium]